MRHTLAALVIGLAAAFATPALAESFKLGTPTVAAVTLPDSWNPEATDTGVEAMSPDEKIQISVDVVKTATADDVSKAAIAALQALIDDGMKLQKPSEAQELKIAAFPAASMITVKGTDADDDPVEIDLLVIAVNETTGLQVMLIYEPGAEKTYDKAISRILDSLKPVN